MPEEEKLVEWRIAKVEVDVKDMKSEIASIKECQTRTNSSLENLFTMLGRLEKSVDTITSRPTRFVDTIKQSASTAIVVALVSAVMLTILK